MRRGEETQASRARSAPESAAWPSTADTVSCCVLPADRVQLAEDDGNSHMTQGHSGVVKRSAYPSTSRGELEALLQERALGACTDMPSGGVHRHGGVHNTAMHWGVHRHGSVHTLPCVGVCTDTRCTHAGASGCAQTWQHALTGWHVHTRSSTQSHRACTWIGGGVQ